jgi:ABC-2 type transport system ATP-binding protein
MYMRGDGGRGLLRGVEPAPMIGSMSEPVLEVSGVRKRYGETVALDGVSLAVGAGELCGLLGPNGAGKTTLIKIACGLGDADAGEVRLFGRPFRRADRDLRRLVGIGTQDLAIYPDLSARENLRFFGKLYGFGGKTLAVRVDEVLAAVGLTDRADDRAGTFSGGMKRRLNLAAGIVHGPKLLFLDEPTTGVDPQSRNHIFRQVKALNAAGLTVVYTSHYMEEVQALCTRIAILDGGQLRACDTLTDLLKMLDGRVRFRLAAPVPGFEERLAALPGAKAVKPTDGGFEVTTDSIPELLPAVLTLASESGTTVTAIEPREPCALPIHTCRS